MRDANNKDYSVKPSQKPIPLLGIGITLVLVAAAFFSGFHIGTDARRDITIGSLFSNTSTYKNVDLEQFWEVWELLDEKFVFSSSTSSVTDEDRIEGAIQGLVESYGDPYTVFLPPVESSIFEEDISGNFGGVGMEVGQRNGVLTVIAPLPNTPAEKAGILAGDLIIRIDEESTDRMSIDEAVTRIRGEKGTEVLLTMFRDGESELLEIPVVRDKIDIPTLDTEWRDEVFIISLYNFSAVSESKFAEAIAEFARKDGKKLIVDLRGNPGGFLQSSVGIASHFLPAGKPVVRESFGEEFGEEVYRSSGRSVRGFEPEEVVVLVDGGSASASEILAGALQEHDVATVMGAQTFGKGSVQELVELENNSSLKVTVARWLTPDGNSISDGGLTPDIIVERTVEDIQAERDPQLDAAIEFLNR